MRKLLYLIVLVSFPCTLFAQDASDKKASEEKGDEIVVETIVEGLTNPAGLAIDSTTGHIFVSDSGANRVVRIVEKSVAEKAIKAFKAKEAAKKKAEEAKAKAMEAAKKAAEDAAPEGASEESPEEEPKDDNTEDTSDAEPADETPAPAAEQVVASPVAEETTSENKEDPESTEKPDKDKKKEYQIVETIVGFNESSSENDRLSGPLGLALLDKNTLVVGSGGVKEGGDSIRAFTIPSLGAEPVKANAPATDAKATPVPNLPALPNMPAKKDGNNKALTLPAKDETVAEGFFASMVATDQEVIVTSRGDDEKYWLGKASRVKNKISNFKRFIATKEATKSTNPGGIAISPEGYLAVSQMGSADQPGDSLITFYELGGEPLGQFSTTLNDISAIAYGPKRKHLFAADRNFEQPEKGGLFKIIADGEAGTKSVKIADLQRPTAMAFHPKTGDLYITVCGSGDNDGKLLVVKGLDKDPNAPEKK